MVFITVSKSFNRQLNALANPPLPIFNESFVNKVLLDIPLKIVHTQNRMRFPARIKRFILVLFLFSVFSLLFSVSPVFAQSPNPYAPPNISRGVPNNLHNWTQNVMIEVMAAMSCQLTGIDPINPKQQCLGIDAKNNNIGFVKQGGGAIGITAGLIDNLFTPPFHGGDYFRYLSENFGLVKKTYAQGSGFSSLSPLMSLWSTFRNIVYLGFVVAFVFIGLAIMLRVKIDPRTVMTIENQIPKIIIGLILVTFSFAIAGFLIDLMWVMIYFIYNIISSSTQGMNITNLDAFNPVTMPGKTVLDVAGGFGGEGLFDISHNVAKGLQGLIANSLNLNMRLDQNAFTGIEDLFGITNISSIFSDKFSIADMIITIISGIGAFSVGSSISGMTGTWFGLPLGSGTGITAAVAMYPATRLLLTFALPYLIVFLVIYLALLFALFRLGFELLKAYIFILVDVVFAPFWIVFGLIPGSPVGFGAWLKDILANLSAFPVTIGMLLLGKIFVETFNNNSDKLFVPPLLGNPTGGQASIVGSLIGLGILLLTPQVVAMMKEAVKAPQFKFGASIGQGAMIGPMMAKDIAHNVFSPYGGLVSMNRAKHAIGFFRQGKWSEGVDAVTGGGAVHPPPKQESTGGGGGGGGAP